MDEPGWQWPAWKFGMKRGDLFTKLHDQYNTISSSIQDPEAFHHDVYEISNTANSVEEFHRLLASRKDQRLRELNQSLEAASVEIIGNPSLIGTEQWQYAIQLFRTRSLDSLVRYFSSYLPDDHPWRRSQSTPSKTGPSIHADIAYFDEPDDDGWGMVGHGHVSIPNSHFPPSPKSMTVCSDGSSAGLSPIDMSDSEYALDGMTPSRTQSFSEPESDMVFSGTLSLPHDEDTSQSEDADSSSTSVSDYEETRSLPDSHTYDDEVHDELTTPAACDETDDGASESETPTPRNEMPSDSYITHHETTTTKISAMSSTSTSMRRSQSASSLYTQVLHEYVRGTRKNHRDGSPGGQFTRRRSPELGRVQKPSPDGLRIRPKGRRRVD